MYTYFSLRMKLDDIIKDKDFEQKVLENIRYCRKIVGQQFKVIFWNENLTEKDCENFVKRNEKILFEITTKITKGFDNTWFLIESNGDKSNWRYKHDGDIVRGIAAYVKMIKHMKSTKNGSDNG